MKQSFHQKPKSRGFSAVKWKQKCHFANLAELLGLTDQNEKSFLKFGAQPSLARPELLYYLHLAHMGCTCLETEPLCKSPRRTCDVWSTHHLEQGFRMHWLAGRHSAQVLEERLRQWEFTPIQNHMLKFRDDVGRDTEDSMRPCWTDRIPFPPTKCVMNEKQRLETVSSTSTSQHDDLWSYFLMIPPFMNSWQ